MFGASGDKKRFKKLVDDECFSLTILDDPCITPELVASVETTIRNAARYVAPKAGSEWVVETLNEQRHDVPPSQRERWNAILDRAIADVGGVPDPS